MSRGRVPTTLVRAPCSAIRGGQGRPARHATQARRGCHATQVRPARRANPVRPVRRANPVRPVHHATPGLTVRRAKGQAPDTSRPDREAALAPVQGPPLDKEPDKASDMDRGKEDRNRKDREEPVEREHTGHRSAHIHQRPCSSLSWEFATLYDGSPSP